MVTVTVTTAEADPVTTGQWSAPFEMGGVAIHATLTHTGEVVFFEYVEGAVGVDNTSRIRVWDPVTGESRDAGTGYDRDLFCAGHNVLPNGQLFASGGHDYTSAGKQDGVGVVETDVYDPVTSEWRPTAAMGQARWYPTNVGLGDGTTLIFGGQADGDTWSTDVESYDPATNTMSTLPPSATTTGGNYPRMHLMPNGKVLKSGTSKASTYFDPQTNQWSNLASMQFGTRSKGTSVLLPGLEKVMAIGGQASTGAATATVEILDTSQPTPQWRYTAPMNYPRIHSNAVTLPDGQVLVVGGGAAGKYDGPVTAAELYDPVAETWTVMEEQQGGRMYHATALLLPDGRVLSAGQDSGGYATMGEIFSPPYLFKGPRPTIASAPSTADYGQSFSFTSPQAGDLGKVALIRPGSVTHTVDTDQRYVGLDFTTSGDTVTVTAPANGNVAPPGYYMLFAVDSAGVPSVAEWVRVGTGEEPPVDSTAPSVPEDVAAVTDGGAVDVTWSASTDDVGVTGYTVRRDGAEVATVSSGLAYSDTAVAAGQTYRYTVEAFDAAGNVSAASAEAVVTVPEDPPGQGISLRAVATGSNAATATLTVPMPTSVAGDVLLATVDVRGKPAVTAPGGWTLIRMDTSGNVVRKATYWRRATASEPASYTWQFSLANSAVGTILAYEGVSATDPIQASSGQANAESTSITAPSLTTTSPDAVVVGLFGTGGNAAIAPPSGMTERSEVHSPDAVTIKVTSETADLTLAQPGPTGDLVATSTRSRANIGHLVALTPAPG